MINGKKSTEEFIRNVIIPIEQKEIDSGRLYVLVRSMPNHSYTDYQEEGMRYVIEDWSFPTESSPGDWIEGGKIKLETLSGIIWHGGHGGRLYKAEFEGEKKNLGLDDYYFSGWALNDYQKKELEAKEHIYGCLSVGVKVKKARLVKRINNWRPYLLWSFALDCIERVYGFTRDLVSDIYKEALIFARAYSKYECGMGGVELEGLVKVAVDDLDFNTLYIKKKNDLVKLISEESELGSTFYLKNAMLEALDPYKPFTVANYIQTAMACRYMGEYRDEYTYPSMITESTEEVQIVNRIWYAFHKNELDWQVDHMSKLVGD